MERIQIIGMNNFVGFHLTKHFLELGIEVIGYRLPIENDFFQLKNHELARNANFQLKELNGRTSSEKTIIDLYGLENKENILQKINHDDFKGDSIILVDDLISKVTKNQLIHLPKIVGRFDYLKEDEKLEDRGIYIGVNELCSYLVERIDSNEPIHMHSFQPQQVEKEWLERNNWMKQLEK